MHTVAAPLFSPVIFYLLLAAVLLCGLCLPWLMLQKERVRSRQVFADLEAATTRTSAEVSRLASLLEAQSRLVSRLASSLEAQSAPASPPRTPSRSGTGTPAHGSVDSRIRGSQRSPDERAVPPEHRHLQYESPKAKYLFYAVRGEECIYRRYQTAASKVVSNFDLKGFGSVHRASEWLDWTR